MAAVLGILLGAGPPIGHAKRKDLKELLETVFRDPAVTGHQGDMASLARRVTTLLEDSPLTNAGLGSELTTEGEVECDASIVHVKNGKQLQASVASLKEIRNPIGLCYALISNYGKLSSGRAIPNFIVGEGATKLAKTFGLETADLRTPRAVSSLEKYSDTVGVIALSEDLRDICVSSSSGGPILKDPGRVGPAAIPGAALFTDSSGRAAVCSGFGEDITAFRLAERVAHAELTDEVYSAMSESIVLQESTPYFGFIKAEPINDDGRRGVIIEWQHTTESMVGAVGVIGGEIHIINSHQQNSSGGLFIPWSQSPNFQ